MKKTASLLFDGSHYRINIPIHLIKEQGWKKGDELVINDSKGGIFIKKMEKEKSKSKIFSIGYEGKNVENFIAILQKAGVQQLIDVRENPFSFKLGFSKTPLSKHLDEVGIAYQHIKELGTERKSRAEYKKTGDIVKLCEIFNERLNHNKDKYEIVLALAKHKGSAIMCFEDNFEMCHRQVIEKKLEKDGFEVVHLCNGRQNKS